MRKLAAAGTNQDPSFQERARKLAAENSDINDGDDSEWPNNFHKPRAYVPHLEKVYSNLRQHLNRKPEDKMEDLDVNTLIWRKFMTVAQQAAVHMETMIWRIYILPKKTATTNSETLVRCDKKVGRKSERKSRFFHDQLARKCLKKDDSVD